MRCPRCRREIAEPVPRFCAGCGAPLRLSDEPEPRPLESSLPIDRRGAGADRKPDETFEVPTPARLVAAAAATAQPEPAPPRRIPEAERSHWELGAPPPRAAPARGASPNTVARPPPVASGAPAAVPRPASPVAPPALLREASREAAREAPLTPADDVADIEVEALEIHLRRAASWRRAAAAAVDVLPFAAGGFALGRALVRAASDLPAPATGLDGFLDLLARERVIVLSVAAAVVLALAAYATLAHALAGATLGKRLFGLRLVGPDGARPTLARSAVRTALAGVSIALLGLGVALAFFTRSGRALHDLVARTWVVRAS
ncbi:MAG TPA: RDD family protein [Anaeromyxobacter sp.]|nr:RDD family protein [Anaeromyxobacter sp.]